METKAVRDLAIKRHDIDADFFQQVYEGQPVNLKKVHPFRYGRGQILEDLKTLLDTLPKGSKVLDIGSGTGHLTQWIQSQGFEVTGLEPSAEMIGHARKNFPNITFTEGISSALPYADGSFDLIVSFEVFRYLDKAENIASYNEAKRVLKPGGQFFFTQVNTWATDYYYFFYYIKKVIYNIKKKVYHYCFFITPRRQEKMMLAAGYSSVTTIGRMAASIRLAYKFGKGFGDAYVKLMEKIFGKQRFTKWPMKSLAGHLLVIAKK